MPRRFVFSLEPVLEQRRRVEEEKLRAVAAVERERVGLEDRLRGLQRELSSARADLRDRLAGPIGAGGGIGAVRMQANASLRTTLEMQQCALSLAGVLRRLERARADLLAATTARKGVERLRERRHAAWRAEESRREVRELDELSTMHAARAAQTRSMPT